MFNQIVSFPLAVAMILTHSHTPLTVEFGSIQDLNPGSILALPFFTFPIESEVGQSYIKVDPISWTVLEQC